MNRKIGKRNEVSRKMASSKMLSYAAMTEIALDDWRGANLTAASKRFQVLAEHKQASENDRQNWLDMAQGCKILANQMKHPDYFNAMCSSCGHDRFWHVLEIACIQCLNPDTKESTCKGFVP